MAEECVFCKIVKGEIPSLKLFENNEVLVVLDIYPSTKGQAMIIPKQHYTHLYELPKETLFSLSEVVHNLSSVIPKSVNSLGLNIVLRMGPKAGQRVPHLAVQMIPRFEGDDKVVAIQWVPEQELQKDLQDVYKNIREELSKVVVVKKEDNIRPASVEAEPKKEEKKKEEAIKQEKEDFSSWLKRRIP